MAATVFLGGVLGGSVDIFNSLCVFLDGVVLGFDTLGLDALGLDALGLVFVVTIP